MYGGNPAICDYVRFDMLWYKILLVQSTWFSSDVTMYYGKGFFLPVSGFSNPFLMYS